MLTQPYTFISGQITLPDSSPNRTFTYSALHGLTRPNYLTRFISQSDFYLPHPNALLDPQITSDAKTQVWRNVLGARFMASASITLEHEK
jgi:hypothetical protein